MINNFESNVQYIKYLVNKEVAKRFFIGNLDNSIDSVREIAEEIIPGPKAVSYTHLDVYKRQKYILPALQCPLQNIISSLIK